MWGSSRYIDDHNIELNIDRLLLNNERPKNVREQD